MPLMTWLDLNELEPYPRCGEREMAAAAMRRPVDFVCMNCGLLTTIEVRT